MATSYNITRANDWEPSPENFQFKKASTNKHGSLSIGFTYKESRMYLKAPKMRVPFGLGRGMNDKGYNIQLSFDNDNAAAVELLEKCKQFDETMIQAGMDHAFEWGITQNRNKTPSRDVVEDRYKAMVKYPRYPKNHPTKAREINPEYPPYVQVTLPETQAREGEEGESTMPSEFITELYDRNKELLPINEETISKQCHCSALIYATSVYSSTTGYGVSWKAAQVMVYPRGGLPSGTCLIDDDDSDEEESSQQDPVSNGGSHPASDAGDNQSEQEEEQEPEHSEAEEEPEEEEEVEPEPEPEPVKTTRKKTVAKKTK